MSLIIVPGFNYDVDASDYIDAVEVADGQTLETGVRYAINDFVIGCKQDGIWTAIKACCIMAGARTLNGALVPLRGVAPTNFNFVAGDYDRKTGLLGNLTSKYLDSNRSNGADPQNNKHVSVYASILPTSSNRPMMGTSNANTSGVTLVYNTGSRINDGTNASYSAAVGFTGLSRDSSSFYSRRTNGATSSVTAASATPINASLLLFRDTASFYGNPCLSFYSIGEALDLALLDARVTSLMTAIGAAIP